LDADVFAHADLKLIKKIGCWYRLLKMVIVFH
jgi:hypothetical protein